MATIVAPEDKRERTFKGKPYTLAGYITFDEYWNGPAVAAFHSHSVCKREGPDKGLQTLYSVWEPAFSPY